MIILKITSGPYKNMVRDISDHDPQTILGTLVERGYSWDIDYSKATKEEKFEWGRWYMIFRIFRALQKGKPVKFMGETYQAMNPSEILEVAQKIEDAVASSGRMVKIVRDDEEGLVIGAYWSLN